MVNLLKSSISFKFWSNWFFWFCCIPLSCWIKLFFAIKIKIQFSMMHPFENNWNFLSLCAKLQCYYTWCACNIHHLSNITCTSECHQVKSQLKKCVAYQLVNFLGTVLMRIFSASVTWIQGRISDMRLIILASRW
jgi:hypothetical protein